MREKLIEFIMLSCNCLCDLCGDEERRYAVAGVIADNLIANEVTIQRWIPVTEMVPESHVEQFEDVDDTYYFVVSDFVLGYTKAGDMVVAQHEVSDDREWWNDMFGGTHIVTHWMPLPEPPKGE